MHTDAFRKTAEQMRLLLACMQVQRLTSSHLERFRGMCISKKEGSLREISPFVQGSSPVLGTNNIVLEKAEDIMLLSFSE